MRSGKNNFFEEHIEKLVLATVGIVCLWLLFTRVILSPNYIEYDGNKFKPGNIDNYISEQSKPLEDKLDSSPEPIPPYNQRADDFLALLDSAIDDIDAGVYLPLPNPVSEAIGTEPKYNLPRVGEVNDVAAGFFRAVAYVPTEQINEDNPYGSASTEPNDVDFVTVEGRFDVERLYQSFYDSFAGEKVRQDWRDPCLAEPVFAAVQLQRQKLLVESGTDEKWSDWQNVPRTKIDHRKRMFEVIEKVEELPPGGIEVRLLQFNSTGVRMDLLQPQAYQIASARQEWFPPSLHSRYVEHQRSVDLEEKRKARETERQQRDAELEQARGGRRRKTAPKTETADEKTLLMEMLGGSGMSPGSPMGGRAERSKGRLERNQLRQREKPQPTTRSKKDSKTIRDFYDELDKILLGKKTDLAEASDPVLFWAHDDTVQPGKCYRYRIRLGLFNPVAGTNRFSESDESFREMVILWSEFSKRSEPVEIPRTLYFFPHQIQEAARTVTVRVCRYVLGYWYSKDFAVKLGEVIGKAVEQRGEDEDAELAEDVLVPETVDYSTGAVLVDVTTVSDWAGGNNLRARHYFDMLYSFDGTDIRRMPVKMRYWPDELQVRFNEIKRLEDEPREPLRAWAEGPRRRAAGRGEGIGEITSEEELIEMMLGEMEQVEKGRRRR